MLEGGKTSKLMMTKLQDEEAEAAPEEAPAEEAAGGAAGGADVTFPDDYPNSVRAPQAQQGWRAAAGGQLAPAGRERPRVPARGAMWAFRQCGVCVQARVGAGQPRVRQCTHAEE